MMHRDGTSQGGKVLSFGTQVDEEQNVFGICCIIASFTDTFVYVTDLSGKETICRVTGEKKGWPR